ncbi:MAG TPA: LysR family transcriptional regulator [Bryobacteraceae bacterium]|nr:LysR family transcriptional regulator [Bryobacteraceae bacterium]
MDRFHLMSVFVAVAEEESFAGGARRLGMSPPAVTRAIAMLEEHLGIKVLTRTTRFVRATDAGLRYLESARRIIAEAEEADEAAAGVHAAPRGHLAVTAPVLFGSIYVMPGIVDYLKRYPDVSVSAMFLDRVVNLMEEGLDVGVRIGELPDSTMRAIRVGHVRRVVCAAPEYLKQYGMLNEPQDLVTHRVICAIPVSPANEWRFGTGKMLESVKIVPRLTVTNNDAAIQAALQGLGVTRLMSYQIAAHLAAGRLTRVLADYEPPPLPIHVLHREGRQPSAKVRSFVDLLVERLRADIALS